MKLISPDYKEIEDFWKVGNLDTDYWTVSSSGSGWSSENNYKNGCVYVYGRAGGTSGSGSIVVTSKVNLLGLGQNFMFSVGMGTSNNHSGTQGAGGTAELSIGSGSTFTTLLSSTSNLYNPNKGHTSSGASSAASGFVTFWLSIKGNNLIVRREYTSNGVEEQTYTGSFSPIADNTTINISGHSQLFIRLSCSASTGSNSSLWGRGRIYLSPILISNKLIGSNKTKVDF